MRFSEGTYPKREREKRRKESSTTKKSVDLKYEDARDDSGMSVLLFPGQGSQFVGMAAELVDVPNVRDMFDRASQILDYDLLRLCVEGPEDRDYLIPVRSLTCKKQRLRISFFICSRQEPYVELNDILKISGVLCC